MVGMAQTISFFLEQDAIISRSQTTGLVLSALGSNSHVANCRKRSVGSSLELRNARLT